MKRSLVLLAMAIGALFAQPAEDRRAFEVVSVKPSSDGSTGSDIDSDNNIYKARNVSLQRLIAIAYGVEEYRVEGPGWLGTERFDLDAKFPAGVPLGGEKGNEALHAMMQNMLASRFGLVVHNGQKTLAVYGLVVAKGGVKISEVQQADGSASNSTNNHYSGTSVTMSRFAQFLSRLAGLPVVDMTGLKGFYTFALDWTPLASDEHKDAAVLTGENPSWEALREAMETKLGLRCENRKAPVGMVVVDHAEKTPTAN